MANWRKTTRRGNTSVTRNVGKGTTYSHSSGNKQRRSTTTHRYNGKVIQRTTRNEGGMTKVSYKTLYSPNTKKIKHTKAKTKRLRKVKSSGSFWTDMKEAFWGLLILVGIILLFI
jgi:hypothetical protein